MEWNGRYYGAHVQALDFDTPTAPSTINAWIEENTNGRIGDMIGEIGPQVVMFLVNAVYFKGVWRTPFSQGLTEDAPFCLADGRTVEVPMMQHPKVELPYYEGDGVRVVALPYAKSRRFRMMVVLPDREVDLGVFLAGLSAESWSEWSSGMGRGEGSLP